MTLRISSVLPLTLMFGSALMATNIPLVNTGITSGSGCAGTAALPAGCTLGAQGATGIQGWTIFSAPSGSSTTPMSTTAAGGAPIAGGNSWLPDNTTSTWLRPANGAGLDPLGLYGWRLSFTLTAQQAAAANGPSPGNGAKITGRYLSDDVGYFHFNNVSLAGNGTGITNSHPDPQTFTTWTPFTIDRGFVEGVNMIQISVMNLSAGFTGATAATGIRVEFSQPVQVPEGGEIIVLTLGLAMALFFRHRFGSARA